MLNVDTTGIAWTQISASASTEYFSRSTVPWPKAEPAMDLIPVDDKISETSANKPSGFSDAKRVAKRRAKKAEKGRERDSKQTPTHA